MSVDTAAPPFYPLTADNRAAVVVVAAVTFLIYAILGIVAKLLIRLNIASLKGHDSVLLAGTVLYFAETVCIIVACNNGLGQHQDAISSDTFEEYSKLIYTSQVLALLVDACTKISLCLLIRQINKQGRLNLANTVLGGFILAWALSGLFAIFFQCHLPNPWLALNEEQCPARGAVYVYNGVLNILTDLALCILPIAMMWNVQTTIQRKMIVIALFGSRVIVPIVTIPALSNASYLFHDYSDSTWRAVPSIIWFQISLGLSVLTACIPSMKGIIDSLMGSTSVAAIQAPYELRDSGKKSGLEVTALNDGSKQGSHASDRQGNFRLNPKKSANHSIWTADRDISIRHTGKESPGGGESVRGLTDGVIVVRDEFEIHYDDKRMSSSRDGSQESSVAGYHHV